MDIFFKLKIKDLNSGACSGKNAWSNTTNAGTFQSFNPADESLLGAVYACSESDYENIVTASQQAFKTWRMVPAPKRGELVRLLGEKIRQNKDALGSLVALEMGKSKQEGDGEVQEMIDIAEFAVGQSRMLYGNTMHSERPEHRMYEQWHPLGPVGVVSAFNFPVAVWSWNAFIAAIAGDTVIWKPSPKTPLCAIAVQHLCNEAMDELGYTGIFSMFIPTSNEMVEKMAADPRLPLISFTGSTTVGRKINQIVAGRLGRCLLELGGNNAIIVDKTANLSVAIPSIVFGAVGTAGQRCTTTRRLLIEESVYPTLLPKLVNAYQQITIGNPLEQKNLMGPLVDRVAVDNYLNAIKEAREMGGEVLCGGKLINSPGFFVEPTIIRAENHWPVVQRETFAPILYVMPYKTLEEAIELQNAVPQGLSSAVFTSTLQIAEQFLASKGSDCGIANVNIGTSGAEIGGAFGGEKDTGGGREAGSDAWKVYMRRQTNTINWSSAAPLAQGIKFDIKV